MQEINNLIAQAQTGDRNALNELVSSLWHPVFRFISYKISSPEDAKELTQETFIKAFNALPHYQKTGTAFSAYLNRIAHNLVIDFWRKKGRSPIMVDLGDFHQPIAEEAQPDSLVINDELRQGIAQVLKELPDEQRQTIEYRIIVGLSIKDTAIAMGKSDAAIKMLQQRALKNLRELLVARGIVESHTGR